MATSSTSISLGERMLGQDLVLHTILQHLTNMNDLRTVQGLVSLYACKVLSKEALRLHLARHEGRQYGVHFGEFQYIGKDVMRFSQTYIGDDDEGDDYYDPGEGGSLTVELSEYLSTKGSVADIRGRIKKIHESRAIELPSHRKKLKSMKTKKEILKEYTFMTYVPLGIYENVRYGVEAKILLESGRSAEDLHGSGQGYWTFYQAIKSLLPVELIRPLMQYACVSKPHIHQALFIAANLGHLDMVKYILESDMAKVDDALTDSGTTCLLMAVTGYLEVVRYLVEEAGADVNLCSNSNKSAFMIAAEYGRLDILEYFWRCGCMEKEEWDDDHDADILRAVIQRRGLLGEDMTLSVLKFLIEKAKCDPMKHDMAGDNLLHFAIRHNLMGVVKYLCSKTDVNSPSGVLGTDDTDVLLETLARYHGNVDMAKLLVQCGANVTYKRKIEIPYEMDKYDPYETGPLIEAVHKGHLELVRYFVGILENHSGDLGWSYKYDLLHNAARVGDLNLVKYAVEEVKVDVDIKDHTSNEETASALHCAVAANHGDVVEYLIAKNADVNLRFVSWTPLMMSGRTGSPKVASMLLDSGKVDIDAVNELGCTALIVAIDYGSMSVSQLLLDRGADPNIVNNAGQNALFVALMHVQTKFAVHLVNDPRVDVLAPNGDGSILKLASDMGNVEVTQALINSGKFNGIFSPEELESIRVEAINTPFPDSSFGATVEEMFGGLNIMPIASDDDEFDSDDDSEYYDSDEDDFDLHDAYFDGDGNYYEMGGMLFDADDGLGSFPFPAPPNIADWAEVFESLCFREDPPYESDTSEDIPSVRETAPEDNIREGVQPDNEPSGASSTAGAGTRSNHNRQNSRSRGRGRRGGRRGRR
jgi:ankyrin repeat protein